MATVASASVPWSQQFATLYLLVSGSRAMTSAEFDRITAPFMRGTFRSPTRTAAESRPVTAREVVEGEPGGVTSAFWEVSGGPFDGAEVRSGDRVITGIKRQLRGVNIPVTLDRLAGFRAGPMREMNNAIARAGFKVVQSTVRVAGQPLPGDRGIPSTPSIPLDPRAAIGIAIGLTMGVAAIGVERLALQGRIPGFAGLGVTDEEFLAAEEMFQNAAFDFDKASRDDDCVEMVHLINNMRSALKMSGNDSDIDKQYRMRKRAFLKRCP